MQSWVSVKVIKIKYQTKIDMELSSLILRFRKLSKTHSSYYDLKKQKNKTKQNKTKKKT